MPFGAFTPVTVEEPRQHHRHLHDAEARLDRPLALEHDAEVEALVPEVRERVAGVDGDRREDREDLVVEARVELGQRLGRKNLGLHEEDPLLGELREQVVGERGRLAGSTSSCTRTEMA